jgi:hypothetical protein
MLATPGGLLMTTAEVTADRTGARHYVGFTGAEGLER